MLFETRPPNIAFLILRQYNAKYEYENKKEKEIAVDGYATRELDERSSHRMMAKRADDYFQEMVVLSHKVDRMERWVLQLAEKVGVQLKA